MMSIFDAPGIPAPVAKGLFGPKSIGPLDVATPKFERLNPGVAIFSAASQNVQNAVGEAIAAPSIYWPWIIDARAAMGADALDEFYMYYTTDHEGTHENSGVWLATGPTELGPWKSRGRIYRDDTGGKQTETASSVWNPDDRVLVLGTNLTATASTDRITKANHGLVAGRRVTLTAQTNAAGLSLTPDYYVINPTTNDFQVSLTIGGPAVDITSNGTVTMNYVGAMLMYYQQAFTPGAQGSQSTVLASSPNGYNGWVRQGIVIDVVNGRKMGDGHTGYFRPRRVGKQWYGYHLYGGADYPKFGISFSPNGRNWTTDTRPLSYGMDQVDGSRRIEWNSTDIVYWQGREWWVGMVSNFVSGSVPKDARLAVAPIGDDMRHIVGPVRTQLYPTIGTEDTNYRSTYAFVGRDGKFYFYYQTGSSFYVAVATPSSAGDAEGSPVLTPLALPRTITGARVPLGRATHELRYDFGWTTASTKPSDITAASGTLSFPVYPRGAGRATLSTAATNLDKAQVKFPDIDLNNLNSVSFTVENLHRITSGSARIWMELQSSSADGASLGSYDMSALTQKGNGDPSFDSLLRLNADDCANITLMLLPQKGYAYVLMDDQVVQSVAMPAMGKGVVTPSLVMMTHTAAVSTVTFSGVRITTEVDA